VPAVDIPGFVTDLKAHAVEHGFHIHAERHFVETYSLGQTWEVELHPEEACGGPLDLHMTLEIDPRVLLSFEDEIVERDGEVADLTEPYLLPIFFNWALPPLNHPPDLLVLATELAGVGGAELPLEVSAIDSFASVTDAPSRSLSIVAGVHVSLAEAYLGGQVPCEVMDRCHAVSEFLLDKSLDWLEGSELE
jgi:hypothetical protein